jgi:hypothetical protein
VPTVLVVENPGDLLRLIEGGIPVVRVNLGGAHHREGTRELWPGYYLDEQERVDLTEILARGIGIEVQSIPGAPAEGIWLGLCMSLLSRPNLPLGQERLRDNASVAVAIPLALGPAAGAADWGVSLLVGVLWTTPLASGIHLLRELGRRAQARAREMAEHGELPPVERWHFGLAGLQFVRGVLAVWITVLLLRLFLRGWHELAGGHELRAMSWLWQLAPLVGVPSLLRAPGPRLWLLPGFLLGGLLWRWLGGGM